MEVRRGPVLAIILASYAMIVLDISIVITALPKIHHELDFSATALSWVGRTRTCRPSAACCCWALAPATSSGGGGCSSPGLRGAARPGARRALAARAHPARLTQWPPRVGSPERG
jgi:hypothetical protein